MVKVDRGPKARAFGNAGRRNQRPTPPDALLKAPLKMHVSTSFFLRQLAHKNIRNPSVDLNLEVTKCPPWRRDWAFRVDYNRPAELACSYLRMGPLA